MSTSPKYGVPYIASSQAQPEVTHNGALNYLQIMRSPAIARQNAPPGGPAEGDVYIVGAAPTGAWAGRANALAGFFGTGWLYVPNVDDAGTPIAIGAAHKGMRVYDQGLVGWRFFDGTNWQIDYDIRLPSYKDAAPAANEVLLGYASPAAWTLPANLVGSKVVIGVAATTPATLLDVQKNGVTCGTISITGTVPTMTTVGGLDIAFASGDVLKIVAPGAPDATLAQIAATILGIKAF